MTKMLADGGHEVLAFGDGHAVLDCLRTDESVDVLMTSFEIPGISGLELCWEARLIANSHRPIHVIAMSSTHDRDRLIEALDSGADDFVTKPPVPAELFARLRAAERATRARPRTAAHGDARRADRAAQPSCLLRSCRRGDPPRRLGAAGLGADARHRPLQAGQRHLRPRCRRRGAARRRRGAAVAPRPRRAARRRGIRRAARGMGSARRLSGGRTVAAAGAPAADRGLRSGDPGHGFDRRRRTRSGPDGRPVAENSPTSRSTPPRPAAATASSPPRPRARARTRCRMPARRYSIPRRSISPAEVAARRPGAVACLVRTPPLYIRAPLGFPSPPSSCGEPIPCVPLLPPCGRVPMPC